MAPTGTNPSFPAGLARQTRSAFTLIELLVSMAVLVMIILFVGQLVTSTTTITVNSGKFLDSDNQARVIFSQMAYDFGAMFKRTDIHYYFHSQSGNDEFYFYSQASGNIASQDPAGTTDATINSASLIGYRVSDRISNGTRVELERLGRGLHWADVAPQSGAATSVLFLPALISGSFQTAIADAYNNSSNPDPHPSATSSVPEWDVIGDQVFRMEFGFLLTSGSFSNVPITSPAGVKNNLDGSGAPGSANDSTAGYSVGSRWYDASGQVAYCCTNATAGAAVWSSLGLQDVNAVVVAIALMDQKSRATTTTAAIITSGSTQLSDFNTTPVATSWLQNTDNVSTFSGLNKTAASSIHVYQRFFYLN